MNADETGPGQMIVEIFKLLFCKPYKPKGYPLRKERNYNAEDFHHSDYQHKKTKEEEQAEWEEDYDLQHNRVGNPTKIEP